MNNQQQIDLNTLTETQLEQLLQQIQVTVGALEIEKQMHIQSFAQVNAHLQNQKTARFKECKMPTLKKITLPKSDEATYTANNQTAVNKV